MPIHSLGFRRGHQAAAVVFSCLSVFATQEVVAQQASFNPPAPVTPGGVRPQLDRLPVPAEEDPVFLSDANGPLLAQNVPAPVTPGGARPQFEDRELPTVEEPDLEIPAVVERPLDIDEGPRVQLQSVELNVDPSLEAAAGPEIMAQAEAIAQALIDDQDADGATIGMIEGAAADITDVFRDAGYVVAWGYVPVQEVRGGEVEIRVLPGSLGTVNIEGNERYSAKTLGTPFEDLIDQPLQVQEVETALLYTRDYPGVEPSAVLSQGDEVGSTNLTMRVEEDRFDYGITGDNYGSELNGVYRARAWFDWNNPLGYGDKLSVDVLQTFDPTDNIYGGVRYEAPVIDHTWRAGGGYSHNAFDTDLGTLNPDLNDFESGGDSDIADLYLTKSLIRSRTMNLSLTGKLSVKQATQELIAADDAEDQLTVLSLGSDFEIVDNFLGNTGINQFGLWLDFGLDDFLGSMDSNGDFNSTRRGSKQITDPNDPSNEIDEYAGGDFTKVSLEYQRFQRVTLNNSILFRGYYQFSDDLLVSLEQLALGGAYTIRAFPTSVSLVDTGGYAKFEWITDALGILDRPSDRWGVNVFLFAEYGGGEINDPLQGEEETVDVSGWGGGFEASYLMDNGFDFLVRLDVSTPISGDLDNTTGDPNNPQPRPPEYDDDDPRFWFSVAVKFP